MDELEKLFADGLRAAADQRPAIAPPELSGLTQPRPASIGRVGRIVGSAAGVAAAALLALWAIQPGSSTTAPEASHSTPPADVRLLRVTNTTTVPYLVVIALPDGRQLTLGEVAAGQTVTASLDSAGPAVPASTATQPQVGVPPLQLTGCLLEELSRNGKVTAITATLRPDPAHPRRVVAVLETVPQDAAAPCELTVREGTGLQSASPVVDVPPTSPAPQSSPGAGNS